MEQYHKLKNEVWSEIKNLLLKEENKTLFFEKGVNVSLTYFGYKIPTNLIEIQLRNDDNGDEEIILTSDVIESGNEWREFDDIMTLSLKEMTLIYFLMQTHKF